MKTYLSIIVLLVLFSAHSDAQNRYFTRTGKVYFLSDAPLEKIDAKNSQATSVFDATSGQFEFAVLMKAFEFEKALMMEHFHENYVESDKYPKVIKGVISNIAKVDCTKDGAYPVLYQRYHDDARCNKGIGRQRCIYCEEGKIIAHSDFVYSFERL